MLVNKRDAICSNVLIEVLAKAQHELKGNEVIAVARVMDWAAELKKRIEEDLSPKLAAPQMPKEPAAVLEEPKKKRAKKDVGTK
jgi:hypothetical protein